MNCLYQLSNGDFIFYVACVLTIDIVPMFFSFLFYVTLYMCEMTHPLGCKNNEFQSWKPYKNIVPLHDTLGCWGSVRLPYYQKPTKTHSLKKLVHPSYSVILNDT